MTDEEHVEAREAIEELRVRDREYLAEQLSGDPEDYRHNAAQSDSSLSLAPIAPVTNRCSLASPKTLFG